MIEHVPQRLNITETTPTNDAITEVFERITKINKEIADAQTNIAKLQASPKTPAVVDILNQETSQLTLLQKMLTQLEILKADLVEEKRVGEKVANDAHKLKMAGLGAKYDINPNVWNEVGAANGNLEPNDRVHKELDPFSQGQEGRDLARLDKRRGSTV